jgi:Tol biopolymer transport system component
MVGRSYKTVRFVFTVTAIGLLGVLIGITLVTSISTQPRGRILALDLSSGNQIIYTMDAADGGNPKNLTPQVILGRLRSPVWSPDGQQIAFGCEYYDEPNLCVMPRSGLYGGYGESQPTPSLLIEPERASEIGEIGLPTSCPSWVAWSSDGRRLVFSYYAAEKPERVCIVSLDKDLHCWSISAVTDERADPILGGISGMDWSPVEDRLAISYNAKIYLTDLDGQNSVLLAEGRQPRWSSNGRRLLFYSLQGGSIWIIDRDGQNAEPVYRFPGFTAISDITQTPPMNGNSIAAWSPDGKYIAFLGTSGLDMCDLISVLNLRTKEITTITARYKSDYWYLDWGQ